MNGMDDIRLWMFLCIVGLIVALAAVRKQAVDMRDKYQTAMANVKAYDSMLGESNKKNAAFELTIGQLESFQDSILKELDDTRNKLKIKDKNLQSLQYVYTTIEKTDSLVLRDTIFKDRSISIDTLIGDDWCQTKLKLEYPSKISLSPKFRSDKHIIVSSRKETVNPPKKFWLFRLFQKKHTVLQLDVVEKNPYVQEEHSKYVKIVK